MSRAGLVRHGVTKNVSVDENYVVKVFYALPDGCTLNLVAGIFFAVIVAITELVGYMERTSSHSQLERSTKRVMRTWLIFLSTTFWR